MWVTKNFQNYKHTNKIKQIIRKNLEMDQNVSSSSNKQLTYDQWHIILQAFLENHEEGRLKHLSIKKDAEIFSARRN